MSRKHNRLREPKVSNEFTKNINVPLTKYSKKKVQRQKIKYLPFPLCCQLQRIFLRV